MGFETIPLVLCSNVCSTELASLAQEQSKYGPNFMSLIYFHSGTM